MSRDTMTLIEKTVFLKSVELTASIPTEALAQIAARSTEVRADREDLLFREGDVNQGAFIVVSGLIELRKAGAVVRMLKEGMAHGELFLREDEPHQYTAVAREDSHVLNLRRADVIDAMLEFPEFGLAMVQDLALRLHKLTERVIELESQIERHEPIQAPRADQAIEPDGPRPRRRGWWWRRGAVPRATPKT